MKNFFRTVAVLFVTFLIFTACSDGSGGGSNETVTFSAEATELTLGSTFTGSVAFSDFETEPETVDVYIEGLSSPVATDVALTDGKFSFATGEYDTGTFNLYVKSGSTKSNVLTLTLSSEIKAPTDIKVELTAANKVKISGTTSSAGKYWFYYSKTNNPLSATYIDWQTSVSQTLILSESGTYYFWVKGADGYGTTAAKRSVIATSAYSEVCSYDFTYTTLSAPTNVTVSATDTSNKVKITCNGTAGYYWFYYGTTDDPEKATYIDWQITPSQTIVLSENGTYYFWVKAADGYGSTEAKRAEISQSAFSDVVEYKFTHTELTAPTNVTVAAIDNTNQVKITCDNVKASYYWFYYGTTNDSEKATYIDWQITPSQTIELSENGTYYFWVKAADGYGSTEAKRAEIHSSDFSEAATITIE